MKDTFKIIGVLTAVCTICAFSLSFVNSMSQQKIALNAEKRIADSIQALVPGSTIKERSLEGEPLYELYDQSGTLQGYAFLAQGQGYQGAIRILAAVDAGLSEIKGIEIIDSVETPGLGAKINDSDFKDQFKGLDANRSIEVVKSKTAGANMIQAISSATITTRAVVTILNERLLSLKKELGRK